MEKSFAIYTLGCKVNQEETAQISGLFQVLGWEEVDFSRQASLYIINTCTVTQEADRKARQMIRRAKRQNPSAIIAVTGCYAQISAAEILAIPGVGIVAGLSERAMLPELVEERMNQVANTPIIAVTNISQVKEFSRLLVADNLRTANGRPYGQSDSQKRARAYLKIEDGCDQFCHYCIVPYARGPVRSLPLKEAVKQGKKLAAKHREIVISGIHIGAYGQDLADGSNLAALIKELVQLPELGRLRLSSIEPQQITEELYELLAKEPKICSHLHLPLQSGSDRILTGMGRKYDTDTYAKITDRLRQSRRDIAITTDIIVGYPGESEEDFDLTYEFCRQKGFADMHIFPFSSRKGTVAASLPDVIPSLEKTKRVEKLAALKKELVENFACRFIDQDLVILPEQIVTEEGQKYWLGHSSNYLPVLIPAPAGQIEHELLAAQVTDWQGKYLLAVLKDKTDGC